MHHDPATSTTDFLARPGLAKGEAPTVYMTGAQREALVYELARRRCRPLLTKVTLNINRYTEAEAAALLAGGLDAMQERSAARGPVEA